MNEIYERFEVTFLSPNVTSLIQSVDQGVILKVNKTHRYSTLYLKTTGIKNILVSSF